LTPGIVRDLGDQQKSLAELQLEWARIDPRLALNRAPLPDFFWAMEETERTRMTYILGIQSLADAVEHEARRRQVAFTPEMLAPSGPLAHLAQRAEMARIERDKDYPHHNAWSLVSMYGALEALVEDVVPHARNFAAISVLMKTEENAEVAAAKQALGNEKYDEMMQTLVPALVEQLFPDRPPRLGSKKRRRYGADRFEHVLEAGLIGAPSSRPIPEDLSDALAELGALRNVLVHRAARIDAGALKQAPTLAARYADGDLIRMNSDDYRTYSAAVWAYGMEIQRRMVGPPEFDFALPDWRDQRTLGV
jgi:hypothetical protein